MVRALVLCKGPPSEVTILDFLQAVEAFEIGYILAVRPCGQFRDRIRDLYPTTLDIYPEPGIFSVMKIDHLVLCSNQDRSYQQWIDAAQEEGVGIINLMERSKRSMPAQS
jgi:hypothetical protein